MNARNPLFAAALAALIAAPAAAQNADSTPPAYTGASATAEENRAPAAPTGLTRFELPKQVGPFDGLKVSVGGGFTVNFQALDHSNTAAPRIVDGKDLNLLADIRPGVSLPSANLNLNVQLARGINMVLESYMSSRHHNEFWVKGGYAVIDASPIDYGPLHALMERTTVRVGMYEPNYGDALYRRSDNGNTLNNPFAENYILDAFTTEPGMDVLVRFGPAFVMGGITTGQNKGDIVEGSIAARPALLAKAGYDKEFSEALRFRLSGSVYNASEGPRTTLYGGDRAGSNYWGVIDDASAKSFTNGRLGATFPNELTAIQINPFVKVGGLELFGVLERAEGKAVSETATRSINQYAGDVVYRFLDNRLYVGGRYNVVSGDPSPSPVDNDITIDRKALAAGWYITPNMLAKLEYVTQSYDGFAASDIRNGAKFDGIVMQAAIGF